MYSECCRLHPHRFTFGVVISERVNTVRARWKVNPIFGWSLALSRVLISVLECLSSVNVTKTTTPRLWLQSTLCLKNVSPLTCYNLDIHEPIAIIFGRSVTQKVRKQTMLCDALFSHIIYLVLQHYLAKEETQKTTHWCIVRATQSNCCSALDIFSPEPCPPPKKPKLNALITRFNESYSSLNMSLESKKLKKSSSKWLNSDSALIQWVKKNAIFVFPVLAGSAEAQVIWGGMVKRLLIAYFVVSIAAKKISKSVHVCQSYGKPKVGRFWFTAKWPLFS